MADDDCADNVISLPNVTWRINSKGTECYQKHVDAAAASASTMVSFQVLDDEELEGFDNLKDLDDDELELFGNAFVKFYQATLSDFILAMGRKQVEEVEKRGAPFKYGLVVPFLQKFPFEDREHVPNSEYYDSSSSEDDGSNEDDDSDDDDYFGLRAFRPPNAHEVFMKFLKQVRESNGYDVDCCPPPRFFSPFVPIGPNIEDENYRNLVIGAAHFAIHKINVETGKSYLFVKLDNVVGTTCSLILLTFSVKEVLLTFSVEEEEEEDDSELIGVRAMVDVPYGTLDYELEEWMFKPPPPTTEEKCRTEKARIGESTSKDVDVRTYC